MLLYNQISINRHIRINSNTQRREVLCIILKTYFVELGDTHQTYLMNTYKTQVHYSLDKVQVKYQLKQFHYYE